VAKKPDWPLQEQYILMLIYIYSMILFQL